MLNHNQEIDRDSVTAQHLADKPKVLWPRMIPPAYYPRTLLIVCQFLMMGAQSYSYSGKPEPVEWLVKKARGKSRMSNCDLTRVGRGNRPIKYSDFFDNQTKPNDISDADWLTMAEKAYDCILDCINDEKLQYLLAGIESGDDMHDGIEPPENKGDFRA